MIESDLIDQIYGTIADPGRWSEVIVRISDYLGAVGGLLNHIGPDGRTFVVLGRLSEEPVKLYQQHYVFNAWSLAMKEAPNGKAVIVNSLIEPAALFKSGFFADVLAPLRVENGLAIRHDALSQAGGFGGFNFCLSARGSESAAHARPRLQRLTAHLGRALDATMEMGRIAGGPRKLAAVLNVMPNAAVLLDRKGRIVHANFAAESLLDAKDGLSFDRNGRLQLAAVLPTESAALTRALALALDVAAGASVDLSEPVRITRPSGAGPLLVIPVPLPPPAFALWELSDTARVLVLIIDSGARNLTAASALQATFGLTGAEARVATLVGSGLSGPQAAQALGVSPATVKTHLARCFEKMGLRSQLELARLISALPLDLPASGGPSSIA
jgi:DNA-binding CsgD family transcriptional regulator/PAS domain-containing protein